LGSAFALSGCATPARMHDEAQLNEVATGCGLALGELIQDESEKKLLFMLRTGATQRQRACVFGWAHKNHLKLAILEGVRFKDQ
jgi:hypothetical protein